MRGPPGLVIRSTEVTSSEALPQEAHGIVIEVILATITYAGFCGFWHSFFVFGRLLSLIPACRCGEQPFRALPLTGIPPECGTHRFTLPSDRPEILHATSVRNHTKMCICTSEFGV